MSDPQVSIVMPVYNAAAYLRQAMDSLLAQTLEDFELLAFDDGSSDPSVAILREYAARDPRVRLFANQHAGYVVWLNEGLRLACGEFYARMDADDIAHPQRLERQVEYLRQHPECVAVGAEVEFIDPDGCPITPLRVRTSHEGIEEQLLQGRGHALVHPAAMFRVRQLREVGGYRQEYETAEDLDLYLRLAERGRLANLPQMLLWYRRHSKSVGHAQHERQVATVAAILEEAYRRRGLDRPVTFRRFRPRGQVPEVAYWIDWVLRSVRAGNYATARKHLWSILRRAPLQATVFSTQCLLKWSWHHATRLVSG